MRLAYWTLTLATYGWPAAAQNYEERRVIYEAMREAYMSLPSLQESVAHTARAYSGSTWISLYDCSDPTVEAFSYPDQDLGFFAEDVSWLHIYLQALGLPETAWAEPLARYEAEGLEAILAAPAGMNSWSWDPRETRKRELVQAIDAKVPAEVSYESECGAGEVDVRLRVDPPGGTVHLIPLFNLLVCDIREKAGQEIGTCPGWRSFTGQMTLDLAGDYHIVAEWPGQPPRNDSLMIRGQGVVWRYVITPSGIAEEEG